MTNQIEKSYVGIDVSKTSLDVFIHPHNKRMTFKNTAEDFKKLIDKLGLFSDALVVMEATGGYEKPLANALAVADLKVAVVNPRQVRDFAKALGQLAKTDTIDAKVIALFADKIEPAPNGVVDEALDELSRLNTHRRQLIGMLGMEKNRLDKVNEAMQAHILEHIKFLEQQLEGINQRQIKQIKETETLSSKAARLKTIKGVGEAVSTSLVANLPELGLLSSRQITALVGLAPYNCDSGSFKGKRTTWGGRVHVRSDLYMATLVAIRHNIQIKQFYQRLCAQGKAKKVALVAAMRKMLIIMNAMLRHATDWEPAVFFLRGLPKVVPARQGLPVNNQLATPRCFCLLGFAVAQRQPTIFVHAFEHLTSRIIAVSTKVPRQLLRSAVYL